MTSMSGERCLISLIRMLIFPLLLVIMSFPAPAGGQAVVRSDQGHSRKHPADSGAQRLQAGPSPHRAGPSAGGASYRAVRAKTSAHTTRGAGVGCGQCEEVIAKAGRGGGKTRGKSVRRLPCHRPGYVDPRLQKDLTAALREMKRVGITPGITSTWRSSGDQDRMYRCSVSRRCRTAHPGLYHALPPGQSVHEAGFAVDISGIATGPRGAKRLTAHGRRIVQIMARHGFVWRYGLADPVHFEADPRRHGYKSLRQAIAINQTRCDARAGLASSNRSKPKRGTHAQLNQGVAQRRGPRDRRHSPRA